METFFEIFIKNLQTDYKIFFLYFLIWNFFIFLTIFYVSAKK